MVLIDSWSRKNRQDKGKTTSRDLGYKVQDGSSLSINVGGGVDDTQDKLSYLESVRAKITPAVIDEMIEIANKSPNLNIFFNNLEERNIPLIYLVAMEVDDNSTVEEDIQSYQIIKNKNLDLATEDVEGVLNGADEDYIRTVIASSIKLPPLKNKNGEEIVEVITGGQNILQDYSASSAIEVDELKNENAELRSLITKMNDYIALLESEDGEGEDSANGLEKGSNNVMGDVEDDSIDEDLAQMQALEAELLKLQREQNLGDTLEESTKEDDGNDGHHVVYIVGKTDGEDRVDAPNYEVVTVEDVTELNILSKNKNNVLVLTNKIKASFLDDFYDWYSGVLNSDEKYRIVTLRGSEVDFEGVEDSISLTNDSLNKYFSSHPLEDYIGSGIADFKEMKRGGTNV